MTFFNSIPPIIWNTFILCLLLGFFICLAWILKRNSTIDINGTGVDFFWGIFGRFKDEYINNIHPKYKQSEMLYSNKQKRLYYKRIFYIFAAKSVSILLCFPLILYIVFIAFLTEFVSERAVVLLIGLITGMFFVYFIKKSTQEFEVLYTPFTQYSYSYRIRRFFYGDIIFPKRVYEGDSSNITITIIPRIRIVPGDTAQSLVFFDDYKEKKRYYLEFNHKDDSQEYLELELWAAGIKIRGEQAQRQKLTAEKMIFSWNCFFPDSGYLEYLLKVRIISSKDTAEINELKLTTKVVKLGNLTKRELTLLTAVFGGLSMLLSIVEIMKEFLTP